MIHRVHLDDEYVDVKNLLIEMRQYKQGIRFENSVDCSSIPKGYMSIEQFRTEAKKSLTKILHEHGVN